MHVILGQRAGRKNPPRVKSPDAVEAASAEES
jgi:hypothetical protein